MVRDTLLDSNHYALLSTEAKLFYVHLLLLADDFGCVGVSETFLRRRAFHDAPSGQKIAALLSELTDADMVRCYEADRACYAFVPRFRQRLQRQTLKHPAPPESVYQDDKHAMELFNKYKHDSQNPTVGQRLATVGQRLSTVGQRPEVKRREEKKTKGSAFALPLWVPESAWCDWIASRKNKPSAKAKSLAIAELEKLRAAGNDPEAVLNQSTYRGWTGLFPVKDAPPVGVKVDA